MTSRNRFLTTGLVMAVGLMVVVNVAPPQAAEPKVEKPAASAETPEAAAGQLPGIPEAVRDRAFSKSGSAISR